MKISSLREAFRDKIIFTSNEVRVFFGEFDRAQMKGWVKMGWVMRLRKGIYTIQKQVPKMLVANEMSESYLSLEWALSYYQMIPENVRRMTSVSCIRSEEVENERGIFEYKKISPELYTGYTFVKVRGREVKIAKPTKALFDWLFLRKIKTEEETEEMRFNLERRLVKKEFIGYIKLMKNRKEKVRMIELFKHFI